MSWELNMSVHYDADLTDVSFCSLSCFITSTSAGGSWPGCIICAQVTSLVQRHTQSDWRRKDFSFIWFYIFTVFFIFLHLFGHINFYLILCFFCIYLDIFILFYFMLFSAFIWIYTFLFYASFCIYLDIYIFILCFFCIYLDILIFIFILCFFLHLFGHINFYFMLFSAFIWTY